MIAIAEVMEDQMMAVATDGEVEGTAAGAEPAERIFEGLRARIAEERFDMWFDRKTRFLVKGSRLTVEAANGFAVRWILGKFRMDVLAEAREVLGEQAEVRVQVGEDLQTEGGGERTNGREEMAAAARSVAAQGPRVQESVINRRYTLEEFVAGPSNQLALRAAYQVAEAPAQQFNPLFIHGHCGLGKTHLLQGICHRFAATHPGKKWLYLTGEQFTNEFLEAIAQKRTSTLRRRIRNADLLVIDDVHFLANKKATQEEFLHTFNQVDGCGKQIVLASDCAPKQIQHLSEQLSSRFVSGMVLRVDSPDLPTRLEILRRRSARNGWNLTDAVLMHIARSATSSVRELEGMLLQVVAGISLIGRGEPAAAEVLASLRERTVARGPVPVEKIVAVVAGHFAITAEAIMGSSREKIVSIARAAAMHLARQHTGMSFPEIGRALGGKNHSTVIAACQRIEGMISGGRLICWNTPEGPRSQAVADVLHDLEAAIRQG
jgi:chromosomal replication initiator protein